MSDWEEVFARYGDYVIIVKFYACEREISVEELYQAFKERLEAEKAP